MERELSLLTTLDYLAPAFKDTDYFERRFKLRLSAVTINPTYPLILLHRIAEPSIHEDVREDNLIKLNKYLKTHWDPSSVLTGTIRKDIKQQIKVLLVPLIVTKNPKIQALVIESIVITGKPYFFVEWPALLPELSSRLELAVNANDFASVVAILHSVNSLFFDKCIRNYLYNWKHCLENFAKSLLTTVESISRKINDAEVSVEVLRLLVEAQRVCLRIFYSLNHFNFEICLVLPEGFGFEDYMDKWMNEFKKCLTLRYQGVEDSSIDELRVAVFHILCSMDDNKELFEKYVSGLVDVVCSMLVTEETKSDQLFAAAIWFLTLAGESKLHHALFSRYETLQQITDGIIFPNVMLRGEDEELFVTNYVEFIKRTDMFSSLNTRRIVACYFFKGIARYHKENITDQKVKSHIVSCLALFDENPTANWRYKECAIYLVDSLGNKVADVESFFRLYIVPELESQDVNAFPMLKAASLKFLSTFQHLIPKHLVMAHLDNVARFLTSDFNAVHFHAADCIHKLLLVKEGDELKRYLEYDVMERYMNHIWASLFNHLQNCKPPSRFVICLVIFMSRLLVTDGEETLVDSINSVQENLFDDFLAEFWIPNVKSITGTYIEVKVSVVASSKLLCESPLLLDPAAEVLWGTLLDGIITLLSQLKDKPYFQLQDDALEEIKDPKHFLLTSLANLSSQFRGRFPPIITEYLSSANQATLLQLCNSYNLSIV